MARRTSPTQGQHDAAVAALAGLWTKPGQHITTNPAGERNRWVGSSDCFPDVVAWSHQNGRDQAHWIVEVETADSVDDNEAKQWAAYANTGVPLSLAVPSGTGTKAWAVAQRSGVTLNKVFEFSNEHADSCGGSAAALADTVAVGSGAWGLASSAAAPVSATRGLDVAEGTSALRSSRAPVEPARLPAHPPHATACARAVLHGLQSDLSFSILAMPLRALSAPWRPASCCTRSRRLASSRRARVWNEPFCEANLSGFCGITGVV